MRSDILTRIGWDKSTSDAEAVITAFRWRIGTYKKGRYRPSNSGIPWDTVEHLLQQDMISRGVTPTNLKDKE